MSEDAKRVLEAKVKLNTVLRRNHRIYGMTRQIGKQGERHYFDIFIIVDGEIERITGLAATACGFKWSNRFSCIYMDGGNYNKLDRAADVLAERLWDSPKHEFTTQWL